MVRVSILSKNGIDYGLEVKGHADFGPSGQDLICAGVSSIVTGGFNALNKDDIDEIKLEEGYAKLVLKPGCESLNVLRTIIIQLKTIEEGYPEFIKIK